MRDLQILILDLQGDDIGELDLTDSDDFALKLTKSIASINDLGRRNTSFSLDFEAPQTKNNNKLLTGLRFATATKEILGKKPCSIMVDGNQVDRGFLYPFESEFNGMYKLVFKGLNNDWVEKLQDVELNQLNWRDYLTGLRTEDATEWFESSRFGVLNAQNSVTSDLVYPYVNRNNTGAAASVRPQLHLRSIILAMFEKIGYTVDSDWLDSDWVQGLKGAALQYDDAFGNKYDHLGLGVDPTFQLTREQLDLIGQLIHYAANAPSPVNTDPNAWINGEMVGNIDATPTFGTVRRYYRFPNMLTGVIQDENSRWNIATSEFTVGVGGTYTIDYDFRFENAYWNDYYSDWRPYSLGFQSPFPPSVNWYVVKNNISDDSIDSPANIIAQGTTINFGQGQGSIANALGTNRFPLADGDKISLFLEVNDDAGRNVSFASLYAPNAYLDGPGSRAYWRVRMNNQTTLEIVPVADIQLGDTFRINSHIPEGIKCLALLQDFKTMFNLYFDVDVNRKKVLIEPRDDFYTNEFEDITERIDFNTPPTLNYLSSYKNEIVFEYATDSNDKFLEQWNKTNDKTYAQFKYIFGNNERFDKGQSTLTTSLISASIQGELESNTSIMGSIVKQEYLDADNPAADAFVNRNYAMRVSQLVKGQQYDSGGVQRRTLSPFIVLTAIMENYGNTPTFEDRRLTFDAENGLVWDYYRKTLANIEDTTLLTIKMNMSLYDFNSWDFKKRYYISEPAEIAGYYITDSIKNFNVTKESPTTVTLFKFRDYTPVEIEGGIGNVTRITQTTPQPQQIMVTVNGAIVPCLDNNLNKMYKQ